MAGAAGSDAAAENVVRVEIDLVALAHEVHAHAVDVAAAGATADEVVLEARERVGGLDGGRDAGGAAHATGVDDVARDQRAGAAEDEPVAVGTGAAGDVVALDARAAQVLAPDAVRLSRRRRLVDGDGVADDLATRLAQRAGVALAPDAVAVAVAAGGGAGDEDVVIDAQLAGKLPFSGPSYIETVNGHLSQPPPKPSTLADLPPELEVLILGCLAKQAAARPALTDVRARLGDIAASLGLDLPRRTSDSLPATAARVPARRAAGGRRPLAISGAIALGSAALVAVVVATLAPKKERVGAPPAVAPAQVLKLQIVTSPPGANVVIDGKKQPLLTPYTFEVPWQASLPVHIERAGYKPFDTTLLVAAGDEARPLDVELQPASQPGGRLSVRANAKHVKWTLDGRKVADDAERLQLDDVAAGSHTLRAEAKGYQPRQETIAIAPRESASLEWTLAVAPAKHARQKAIDEGASDSSWPPR